MKPEKDDIAIVLRWPAEVTEVGPKLFTVKFLYTEEIKQWKHNQFVAFHVEDTFAADTYTKEKDIENLEKALVEARALLTSQGKEWGSEVGRNFGSDKKLIRSPRAINYIQTKPRVPRTPKKKARAVKSNKAAGSGTPPGNEELDDADQEDKDDGDVEQDNEDIEDMEQGNNEDEDAEQGNEGDVSDNGNKTRKRVGENGKTEDAPGNSTKRHRASTSIERAPEMEMIKEGFKLQEIEQPKVGQEEEQKETNELVQQVEQQADEPEEDIDDSIEEERVIEPDNASSWWPSSIFQKVRFWGN